jgi:hypothetical protein
MLRSDKMASGGALAGAKAKGKDAVAAKRDVAKPAAKTATKGADGKPMPASHRVPNDPRKIAAEKSKVMTPKQWENSATDAAMDRKVAKSKGQTLAQYEGSKLDERNDAKQLAAHNKAARAMQGKGKGGGK